MATSAHPLSRLSWVLHEHLLRLAHTRHALLLSADGLKAVCSDGIDRDMADRVAAAVAGMQALSRELAEFSDCGREPCELTMIQYRAGYIFLMAAGSGTHLAVSAGKDADVEAVSYAMERTVDRLGTELGVALRGAPDRPL